MTNGRLNNLIEWLTNDVGAAKRVPDSKYHISDASRDELLEELTDIRDEIATKGTQFVPWKPEGTLANHAPQNSKLMNKFGVPLKLNDGESILQDMTISALPDEHPKLVITYLYIGEPDENNI